MERRERERKSGERGKNLYLIKYTYETINIVVQGQISVAAVLIVAAAAVAWPDLIGHSRTKSQSPKLNLGFYTLEQQATVVVNSSGIRFTVRKKILFPIYA